MEPQVQIDRPSFVKDGQVYVQISGDELKILNEKLRALRSIHPGFLASLAKEQGVSRQRVSSFFKKKSWNTVITLWQYRFWKEVEMQYRNSVHVREFAQIDRFLSINEPVEVIGSGETVIRALKRKYPDLRVTTKFETRKNIKVLRRVAL